MVRHRNQAANPETLSPRISATALCRPSDPILPSPAKSKARNLSRGQSMVATRLLASVRATVAPPDHAGRPISVRGNLAPSLLGQPDLRLALDEGPLGIERRVAQLGQHPAKPRDIVVGEL